MAAHFAWADAPEPANGAAGGNPGGDGEPDNAAPQPAAEARTFTAMQQQRMRSFYFLSKTSPNQQPSAIAEHTEKELLAAPPGTVSELSLIHI